MEPQSNTDRVSPDNPEDLAMGLAEPLRERQLHHLRLLEFLERRLDDERLTLPWASPCEDCGRDQQPLADVVRTVRILAVATYIEAGGLAHEIAAALGG